MFVTLPPRSLDLDEPDFIQVREHETPPPPYDDESSSDSSDSSPAFQDNVTSLQAQVKVLNKQMNNMTKIMMYFSFTQGLAIGMYFAHLSLHT